MAVELNEIEEQIENELVESMSKKSKKPMPNVDEAKVEPKSFKAKEAKIEFDLGFDLPKTIHAALLDTIEKFVNENGDAIDSKLADLVRDEVKKLKPNTIHVNKQAKGTVTGDLHEKFEDALFFALNERQLLIVGDAGSGKTTLAGQLAKALELPFGHISCSAGMSEAHLLGRMLFDGTYVESDLVRLFENGGVFLFDEIDAADANTMLVINSALANGILSVPNRKEKSVAERHEDFICICAGNTWGAGSSEYHGRNYLDAAFLDRFACSKLEVSYDRNLESNIMEGFSEEAKILWSIREDIKKNKLRRIMSTRVFGSCVTQLSAGKSLAQILKTYSTGWSMDEIAKIEALKNLQPKMGGAN